MLSNFINSIEFKKYSLNFYSSSVGKFLIMWDNLFSVIITKFMTFIVNIFLLIGLSSVSFDDAFDASYSDGIIANYQNTFYVFGDIATSVFEAASPIAYGMSKFHNLLTPILIFIGISVVLLVYEIICDHVSETIDLVDTHEAFSYSFFFDLEEEDVHEPIIEFAWTTIPAYILFLISLPSFSLLYALGEKTTSLFNIKVIGRQWYWHYEVSENTSIQTESKIHFDDFFTEYDSYVLYSTPGVPNVSDLLNTDTQVFVPAKHYVGLFVTSDDVIHSWSVPSLGIKLDAAPGRITTGQLYINRLGYFYGQCSELCGVQHGFMPITIHSVTIPDFVEAMNKMGQYGSVFINDIPTVYVSKLSKFSDFDFDTESLNDEDSISEYLTDL